MSPRSNIWPQMETEAGSTWQPWGRSNIKFVSTWSPLLMASLCQNHTQQKIIFMRKILFSSSKRFALLLLLHTKTERVILIQTLPPHTSHPKYLDLLAKNERVCHKDILGNPLFRIMVQMQTMVSSHLPPETENHYAHVILLTIMTILILILLLTWWC